MSNRFDNRRLATLGEQAYTEAREHFAEHFKQFPASREAVERLEKNAAKIALAANMAASKTSRRNPIQTDDSQQWHKCVDLMDNICLCHRPIPGGTEYAVVEHFPARGMNKIWNRGWNAVEVLSLFAQEQRQALEIWTGDMRAQVQEFLAEKYPGQDMNRVADSFMHRFTHAVSKSHTHAYEQNHSRGIRI